jgi:hypothetical protein
MSQHFNYWITVRLNNPVSDWFPETPESVLMRANGITELEGFAAQAVISRMHYRAIKAERNRHEAIHRETHEEMQRLRRATW